MTNLRQLSTCIICFLSIPYTEPEPVFASDTFSQFCKYPAHFGKGEIEGTARCTVTYPKRTENKQDAADFCRKTSQYAVVSSKEGAKTVCVYEKEYVCDEHEQDIFDHCFVVKKPTGEPFSPDACPEGYSLHVITCKEEIQWASVIFQKYPKVWTGNVGKSADFLKPTKPHKPRKRDAEDTKNDEKPVFIALKDGYRDKTKRGQAYYGETNMQLPYLCSREADPFEEKIEEDNKHLGSLGFDIYSITGKDGQNRSYMSFTKMYAVESSRYEADFKNIHKACKVVKGHVATREDFETEDDYRKVLAKVRGQDCV
ncbi:hypothetical protein Aduo_007406 [Ancylostoma duodenale]